MDIAILKKMSVYAAETKVAELLRQEEVSESTLIKADISLFHQLPDNSGRKDQVKDAQKDEEPSPTATDDEVEVPRTLSPREEYERGVADGKSQSDAVHQETIKLLQNAVNKMQEDLEKMARRIEASHLSAVATILESVFPELVQQQTEQELVDVLRTTCGTAVQGQVVLSVHPDDLARCETLCETHAFKVMLVADESIPPLRPRISWQDGGAGIDCQSVAASYLDSMKTAIANLTDTPTQETSDDESCD